MSDTPHIAVLPEAVCHYLRPDDPSVRRVVDGTLGAGGHTRLLLEKGVEHVLGLDIDPQAIALAEAALESFMDRVTIRHASYTGMQSEAAAIGWDHVDGILMDFGVSSMQLDTASRGFAFMADGELDMRFDPTGDRPTASEIVNHWAESDLADILWRYGEERHSRRIARAIIAARPLATTTALADVIKTAMPRSSGGKRRAIHPATRTFQAIRIAVNDELGRIEAVLPRAIDLLRPGGRLAVISFHSLEDRIVKHCFKEASHEVKSPPGMMLEEKDATVKLVTRKPISASDEEIMQNPRSRSAKLRVVEKLAI